MNPILLQKQLRQNASDLQDFCKDLKEWGETMKRKEESIKKSDSEKKSPNTKVRKIHTSEKKTPKKEVTTKKPTTKIGVTDYAAWEKFDAEAECERLEDDINDDSELTDECNEKQDEALIEKEKGNKFVHQQKWDEAITCYTKAIECYSFDPIFFANRALCYLKKNKFQEAERDCTLSIKLDNTYVKAYQRRAAAKEALGKFEEAEYDVLRVLELEPKNKECLASLQRLRKQLGKFEKPLEQRPISKFTASRNKTTPPDREKFSSMFINSFKPVTIPDVKPVLDTSKPVSVWPEQSNIILVKPINKPPHLRSKKPLKRIEIKEVQGDKIEDKIKEVESPKEVEAVKKHVFENKNVQEIIQEVSKDVSEFKKKQIEKNLEKLEKLTALPKPGVQNVCLKSDDLKIVEKNVKKNLPNTKDVKNTSNINISNGDFKASVEQEKNVEFPLPKTSVQFYLTWKNLKNSDDKYKYLKMIRPNDLPKIFLDSLESNIFSSILEVLVKHFIEKKECVFDILYYLTEVKRFGTLVMFKTSADINNLWKLFDYIKEAEIRKNKEDVDALIQKYEL